MLRKTKNIVLTSAVREVKFMSMFNGHRIKVCLNLGTTHLCMQIRNSSAMLRLYGWLPLVARACAMSPV